jgi:hypothetical protein
LFALSDALAITPALPVAFVFARRRRPIALLSLPARPSPCRSPALVAAMALSCPPGMKTLLASFQQTAARPQAPACASPPTGLLIFSRACRILNRAHGSVAPGSSCLGGESHSPSGRSMSGSAQIQDSIAQHARPAAVLSGFSRHCERAVHQTSRRSSSPSALVDSLSTPVEGSPHSARSKFHSPVRWWFTVSADRVENGNRLVKRRRALVETNPPRNSWLQTHQDDETRGGAGKGFALRLK